MTTTIDLKSPISDQIFLFMERQGEQWAARREVIRQMAMALTESCEIITDHQMASGPLEVTVYFDEYNLDAEIAYEGSPLPFTDKRPGEDEILSDPSAQLRLGCFLIRGYADRVISASSGSRAVLKIHMEH